MTRNRFLGAAALTAAVGAAACATDAPTVPAPARTAAPAGAPPAFSIATTASTTPSWANQALTSSQLNRILESEKRRIADAQEASKRTYDSLKTQWDAFKKTKPSPTASPYLMCDPLQYTADTKIIGPDGGDMGVGPHKLSIPRGALTRATVITVEMPATTGVGLRFSPHGQQFARPLGLELSYKHCYEPDADVKSIVYVNDAMQALAWPLTTDAKDAELARTTISHFSGYIVGWSRTRTW